MLARRWLNPLFPRWASVVLKLGAVVPLIGAIAPDAGSDAWQRPARLLKPLGNPPPNSVKFFAASELLEHIEDRTWLARVTNAAAIILDGNSQAVFH